MAAYRAGGQARARREPGEQSTGSGYGVAILLPEH